MFFACAVAVFVLDQLTKLAVINNIPWEVGNPTYHFYGNSQPIPIIEDFLSLTTGNVSVKLDKKGFMLLESTDGVYLVTPRPPVKIAAPKAKPEKTEKAEKKPTKKIKKAA